MTNQFFYTRKEGDKSYTDSFNVNKVIRTLEKEDGTVLVLIDDLHERSVDVPDIDPKNGKYRGTKRQRDAYQSEITISAEDYLRLRSLTERK